VGAGGATGGRVLAVGTNINQRNNAFSCKYARLGA